MQANMTIALDRSVRRIDEDGHLFIDRCIISAAVVSPYYGREIPDSEALGLNPNELYWLYRDEAALAAAAETMNGKPLVEIHQPLNAEEHPREITVGSVHNCFFEAPNLIGELSIWDGNAIKKVENGTKKSVSAGYSYRAIPEQGVIDGQPYTLKMVDIRFNHLALVEEPRVKTAVIGDSGELIEHNKEIIMAKRNRTNQARQASALSNALKAGKLGLDSSPDEILKVLAFALDEDDDKKAEDEEEDDKKKAEDEDDEDKKSDAADEDDDKKAEDDDDDDDDATDEDDDDDKKKKTAQDAALKMAVDRAVQAKITQAVDAALVAERRRHNEAVIARHKVRPLVGDITGMDSAPDIYRYALKELGVPAKDAHPSALPSMIDIILQERMAKSPRPAQAMDSGSDIYKTLGVTKIPKKL